MGWYVPVGDVSTYQYNGISIHVRSPSLFSLNFWEKISQIFSGEIFQKSRVLLWNLGAKTLSYQHITYQNISGPPYQRIDTICITDTYRYISGISHPLDLQSASQPPRMSSVAFPPSSSFVGNNVSSFLSARLFVSLPFGGHWTQSPLLCLMMIANDFRLATRRAITWQQMNDTFVAPWYVHKGKCFSILKNPNKSWTTHPRFLIKRGIFIRMYRVALGPGLVRLDINEGVRVTQWQRSSNLYIY